MKKLLPFLLVAALLIPVALFAMQDTSPLRIEITGVNATELPTASITANVYDNLGQPVRGLTVDNFALTGSLADLAQIVDVQNISDDNLPFATVLVIDISSSMDGVNPATSPIQRAKNAASAFVENIRPDDPVALVTFGSTVEIVQPYTTDKDAILAAIDGINHGGETALYQAGYDAVRLAAESPLSRRVVILLSDGAEYGGNSQVGRDAASLEALTRGVPVYTIGLGFGTDRTYLENLSTGTNARFYESPTPDELEGIYQELAALLRSQYVITLNADVPLDGTEYDFGIQVTTDAGTAEATSTLRAPIPVPVVRLPDLPVTPIVQPVTITAQVLADDPVTSVSFAFDDNDPVTLTEAPYTFSIDPALLLPGSYPLTVAATDEDEEVGFVSGTITIGALPPVLTFDPNPSALGEIADPVTVTITTAGQTPVTNVSIAYDTAEETIELTAPYTFTIDPVQFTPGAHLVTVLAVNEGGQSAIRPVNFTVAAIPPTVTIRGLEDGQSIDEPVTFTVTVVGQGSLTALNASVADTVVVPDSAGLITLDPQFLVPGANEVTVSATSDNGMTGSTSVTVLVAALEPQILVSGIEPDETIEGDTDISIDFFSQTPITSASVSIDGDEIAELEGDPAVFTLTVLDFTPGEHTLTIEAQNQSGQTGSIELPFSISPAPAASATAAAQAQATATQTVIDATASAEAVSIAATATAQAVEAAASATAQFSIQATATAVVQNSTGTAEARIAATQTADVAVIATATAAAAESTQVAQFANATATSEAAAGISAQATQTAQQSNVEVGATATINAELTAEANRQAAQDELTTATALAQLTADANAQAATSAAQLTADANAQAATSAAQLTADANALATNEANATATGAAQMTQDALTAEVNAQATQAALTAATADAAASATQIAEATRSVDATATSQQQMADIQSTVQVSTRSALATSNAEARLNAQATQDSRGTRTARTATAEAQAAVQSATATAIAATTAAQAAAIADETATAIAEAIATQTAQAALDAAATATADAGATATIQQLAIEATATGAANATERANLLATEDGATVVAMTDTVSTAAAVTRAAVLAVTDVARTAIAQETVSAQQTAVGPTATLAEVVAQAATETTDEVMPTPQGTLTPQTTDAPPSGSDSTPIILVVIAVIVILLLLFFALRRGNNSQRR